MFQLLFENSKHLDRGRDMKSINTTTEPIPNYFNFYDWKNAGLCITYASISDTFVENCQFLVSTSCH